MVVYLDHYVDLYTRYIAFHLRKQMDFRHMRERMKSLIATSRRDVQRVSGLYILCTGRLNVRKVLRKQRQWLIFGNVSRNTFDSFVSSAKEITINKFGTYGINVWLKVSLKKPLFPSYLRSNTSRGTKLLKMKGLKNNKMLIKNTKNVKDRI